MEVTFYTKYHGLKVQPIQKYLNHTETVLSKYGEAIVVFDGYDVASTKDPTHTDAAKINWVH